MLRSLLFTRSTLFLCLGFIVSGMDSPARAQGFPEVSSGSVIRTAKDIEVEAFASPRTVSPGGMVTLLWTIYNLEETDERVRLRVIADPGWKVLDAQELGRELVVEADDEIEGELRLVAPPGAQVGERHPIRLLVEVVGEPGVAEALTQVQIVRKGGLRPGALGVTGTTSIQATGFDLDSFDRARYGGAVDLSGRLGRQTTLSLSYQQGPRENNLSNFRISQEETRWSGTLRHPGWNLQFGNQVNSSGNVLTGPFVRGQGVSLRRTEGRLIGDLTVAEPRSFVGDHGGQLVRGSLGLRGRRGRIGLAFSDFSRPAGGYSTVPLFPVQDLDPDSLERLERERQAVEKAPSNRVQGAGVEMELQLARMHRLSARGGWLRLENARGDTIQSPSAEAQYSFHHRRANLSARWRQMPSSLQGIHLPGNEMALDGSLEVIGDWGLAGNVYRNLNETVGSSFRSEGEGASFGTRHSKQRWRLDLRGNYREWSWGEQPTVSRTAYLSFGMPVGPLNFSGHAERGEQDNGIIRGPMESYRGDLRWIGKAGTASWSMSYHETLSSAPRLRTDILGSLKLADWELAGGAWATRGWEVGGEPGFWSQVGIPLSGDLLMVVGVEHAAPAWGQPPTWLGTLGIRKKLAIPIPFLREGAAAAPAAVAPRAGSEDAR